MDADGYLFITDLSNLRIVRSGPNGFRTVTGGFGQGSTPHQLSNPSRMSLDRDGNLFGTDGDKNRIQKFRLSNNSSGKYSRSERLGLLSCFSVRFHNSVFDIHTYLTTFASAFNTLLCSGIRTKNKGLNHKDRHKWSIVK